jgi:hypothetical protein
MDSARDFAAQSESPACPATGFAVEPQHCICCPDRGGVTGSVSVCERLYDLLRGPSSGGMLGHIKMQHLATIVFQDNKHEQELHCDGRYGKEIGGYDLTDMVVQESFPSLTRRAAEPAQNARDSALGNGDTKHLEFAVNSGCAPQRICGDHLCDQSAEFCGDARPTSTPALRLGQPRPESPEPLALPVHNGVCLPAPPGARNFMKMSQSSGIIR